MGSVGRNRCSVCILYHMNEHDGTTTERLGYTVFNELLYCFARIMPFVLILKRPCRAALHTKHDRSGLRPTLRTRSVDKSQRIILFVPCTAFEATIRSTVRERVFEHGCGVLVDLLKSP